MIPVRGFEDKTVAVFGLGRTGLTAARALIAGGAKVALWDEKSASREAAAAEGFPVVDLQAADWSQFAALMLSPGVPLTHPKPHWTVEKARAAGVEVLGDVELFARTVNAAPAHKRPKIIAISGTNGKSTTTALLGHLCASAGRDTRVGGNIGLGVLGLEDMHGGAVYVLELSSYQLDLTSSLHPDAVVLLNAGMGLLALVERFGLKGDDWLFRLAVEYGRYEGTAADARGVEPCPDCAARAARRSRLLRVFTLGLKGRG